VAKFVKNNEGLIVYIREGTGKRVAEIVRDMEGITWVSVSKKRNSKIKVHMGFVYSASQTS
jgi:hypothetical protein